MRSGVRRYPRVAAATDDGGRPRGKHLATQGPAHQVHSARRAHQPAALGAVGRQHRLQPMLRELGAQFYPGGPVAFACPLDAGGQVMPGQFRERQRVPPQHAVHPVVRRHHVQQPDHRGLLESLTARRVNPDRPAGRDIACHGLSIEAIEHTFHSIATSLRDGVGWPARWGGRLQPGLADAYRPERYGPASPEGAGPTELAYAAGVWPVAALKSRVRWAWSA
jgi:hypothetical protein